MTKNYHVQCRLMSRTNDYTTSWIPEKFAHHGKFVKLKNDKGEWEDGWMVIEVNDRMPSEYIAEHERDYRSQRKASDI